MEWVVSTLHTTSEHGVSSITTADAHTSAARSKAWVCDRLPAEIMGSNPTGGMDICLF